MKHRGQEYCPKCGKPLEAIHRNMGDDFVGDTFIRYKECDCKPQQQLAPSSGKELWGKGFDMGLTIANNICMRRSDDYNGDDFLEQAIAAIDCAKEIRGCIGDRSYYPETFPPEQPAERAAQTDEEPKNWMDVETFNRVKAAQTDVTQPFEKFPELAKSIKWFANNVHCPGSEWNKLLGEINKAIKTDVATDDSQAAYNKLYEDFKQLCDYNLNLREENKRYRAEVDRLFKLTTNVATDDDWISVEDRLPEVGRILVFSPVYPEDSEMRFRLIDFQFLRYMTEVTHWKQVQPPKQ